MIKESIRKVVEREDLTLPEAQQTMEEIMSGEAAPAQIASFITALRMKGETVEEISGFAKTMRSKATQIKTEREPLIDTCGTGGDGAKTFNISTATAFVAAGAGIAVAKHGNRSVSSNCGSADVLKELGVNLELSPEKVGECIDEVGIGFLYAPLLHKAMKYAIGPRREMGIRTVFNILGPLTNPAGAKRQIMGVFDINLTEALAEVLQNLGGEHCFVVHSEDGLDEITITGVTKISEAKDGKVDTYYLDPRELGFKLASLEEVRGGDVKKNAQMLLDVLGGENGPTRDIVLLNSAAAIIAGGKVNDFAEGLELARESIDSGEAMRKLSAMREFTNAV
jgi:anthranilate phosphoribosyltransferase